jgi:hypothetical protein
MDGSIIEKTEGILILHDYATKKKCSCFICFALKLINRNTRLLVLKRIGLDDGGKSSTWSRNYK